MSTANQSALEAAFGAATTTYYALRNASDLEMSRRRKEAAEALKAYADQAGIEPADALTKVADWVDDRFRDLD